MEYTLTKDIGKLTTDMEEMFVEELRGGKTYFWITADGRSDGTIGFLKTKTNPGFFTAKLKRFPKIVEAIKKMYPTVNIDNSYATKLMPRYVMKMHVDKNRDTAILIPLGSNKGTLSHLLDDKLTEHVYTGPALARVDIPHSASNTSDEIRYALTLEVPGSFEENLKIYI